MRGDLTQDPVTKDSCAGIGDSRYASFDLIAPDGTRCTVDGVNDETTVADLVTAIGASWPAPLCLGTDACHVSFDDSAASGEQRLIDSGARHGSRVRLALKRIGAATPVIGAVWIGGPDAGMTFELSAGMHVIGRASTAAVWCCDPELELHHAWLEVRSDATVYVTQLAGAASISIDGIPADGRTSLCGGQLLQIGASVLEVCPRDIAARGSGVWPCVPSRVRLGDPWRTPLVRTPRALQSFDAAPVAVPERERVTDPASGGLLPAALGVIGAAAMALLLHQVMFLLFGVMGAMVAGGTWIAQRLSAVRSRKMAREDHARSVRNFADALRDQKTQARAVHLATTPTLGRALETMNRRTPSLWSVRPSDPDAFIVSIGIGEATWAPLITGTGADTTNDTSNEITRAARLDRVPVAVTLTPGSVTAVIGAPRIAAAIARSIVVQLAASSGPADWQLGVVTDNIAEWQCLSWLAHVADQAGVPRIVSPIEVAGFVGDTDVDDARMLVLVVDNVQLFAARTSPMRRLLASRRPVAVVLLCATPAQVPAAATRTLTIGPHSIARWIPDTRSSALPDTVHVAGLSVANAEDAAASIADLIDPEMGDESTALPRDVGIMELLAVVPLRGDDHDPDVLARTIAASWQTNGADPAPCTPLGVAADGVVEVDLVADGPHVLVAGTTGAGKSELLRSLVVGLATRLSPEQVTFVLIDYKGGSTFDACVELPHVVGLVTDLDERLGTRALRSLHAELRRRERLLRDVGAMDLSSYRLVAAESADSTHKAVRLPRLVVVIDEFATLAVQQPDFIGALLGIAQRGRSLGVHLVLATQRPSGVISDDIRANTNLRIALRVQDTADSNDVVGDSSASLLPRGLAGRAIMRLGNDETITFQTARSTGAINSRDHAPGLSVRPTALRSVADGRDGSADAEPLEPTEIAVLVRAICRAAELNALEPTHRPWLPPLAHVISNGSLDPDRIGLIDDPDAQCQFDMTWSHSAGHLLLVGASGMGATSALLTIAAFVLRNERDTELFVIDAMGDVRLKLLERMSGCVGVVRLHERERLTRLLDAVDRERLSRKERAWVAPTAGIVVMIDGIGALRSELETNDLFDQLAQLDVIIAEGQSVGISVILTTTQPGSVPAHMLSLIAQRWVFHLADPLDASLLGASGALSTESITGRVFDVRTSREAQLTIFDESTLSVGHADQPRPPRSHVLRALPADFALADLDLADRDLAGLSCATEIGHGVSLPLGLAYSTLEPVLLDLPSCEHILVIGPYRSGRSTAMRTIVHSWQSMCPQGWIASVAPRRNSVRAGHVFGDLDALVDWLPADGNTLIVVDDAELVDDANGALAALIASRREGVTVVGAARPDALRSAYGHWTNVVRRSRIGLVMAACSDIDGDLLNVIVPRRLPIASRPGLAWLVAEGDMQLMQIARVAEGAEFARAMVNT